MTCKSKKKKNSMTHLRCTSIWICLKNHLMRALKHCSHVWEVVSKFWCFHQQFFIALLRFCTILGVTKKKPAKKKTCKQLPYYKASTHVSKANINSSYCQQSHFSKLVPSSRKRKTRLKMVPLFPRSKMSVVNMAHSSVPTDMSQRPERRPLSI